MSDRMRYNPNRVSAISTTELNGITTSPAWIAAAQAYTRASPPRSHAC